jgi:uncharacterized protein
MLGASPASEFVFVVKLSKFCNLRCAYCYEHRELHVRDTMGEETLRSLFADIDRFGDHLSALGIPPKFSFVWHGGEPLLLPREFYVRTAELQNAHIRKFAFRNSVQTNLFGIDRSTLKFVSDAGWKLGVSIDFAEGIRTNAGRRDSNASVMRAAEALRKSGGHFGAISVLGTHNAHLLADAYDWVAEFADGWRILPAFEGGPEENMVALRLPDEDVVRVLLEIFRRRANSKKHIRIAPLDDHIKWATLKIAGQRLACDAARDSLDNIFVVNVNGDVFTRPFAYDPAHRLGNIRDASMIDMIAGPAYRSCQSAITRRKIRNCTNCESFGFCDTSPMHEHGAVAGNDGRCVVTRGAVRGIESELVDAGIDSAVIASWARDHLALEASGL